MEVWALLLVYVVLGALASWAVLAVRRADRRALDALREERAAAPSPSDPWDVVVARRCVVNLKTGRALDGVMVRKDGPLLFLKNAVLLEEGSEPAAIDGEAVVLAGEIDFIQAL